MTIDKMPIACEAIHQIPWLHNTMSEWNRIKLPTLPHASCLWSSDETLLQQRSTPHRQRGDDWVAINEEDRWIDANSRRNLCANSTGNRKSVGSVVVEILSRSNVLSCQGKPRHNNPTWRNTTADSSTQEQTLTSAEKNTTKSSITTRSKIKEKTERLGLK